MPADNKDCSSVTICEKYFGQVLPDNLRIRDGCSSKEDESIISEASGDSKSKSPIQIKAYEMSNCNRMKVTIITYGATITSIQCPDKYGDVADVVMGFDDITGYLDPSLNQFIGCVLGRCANRIADGIACLRNNEIVLTRNDENRHHIHGGTNGFGRRIWESYIDGCTVVMTYLSTDGEEGYPGDLLTTIKFKLTDDNRLEIGMRATTTKKTIVNLSYGSIFNLAGHNRGEYELRNHEISLNCDRWTFAEFNDPVPRGAIRGVFNTVMDLRIPRKLNDMIDKVPQGGGYDHNFGVVRNWQPGLSFVARALHPTSGRYIEFYSDQPGLQFYTCGRFPPYPIPPVEDGLLSSSQSSLGEEYENDEHCHCQDDKPLKSVYEDTKENQNQDHDCPGLLNEAPKNFIPGKNGAQYKRFGGFSIQPQIYPNAVNIPHFPCAVLNPGQVYYHDLCYKFGIQLQSNI